MLVLPLAASFQPHLGRLAPVAKLNAELNANSTRHRRQQVFLILQHAKLDAVSEAPIRKSMAVEPELSGGGGGGGVPP